MFKGSELGLANLGSLGKTEVGSPAMNPNIASLGFWLVVLLAEWSRRNQGRREADSMGSRTGQLLPGPPGSASPCAVGQPQPGQWH